MSRYSLDHIDHAILDQMVANPSATLKEIGDALGLSKQAVHTRRTRLEDRGILSFQAVVQEPK
jgi:DNA-binding Lrp family transcriptional regulator